MAFETLQLPLDGLAVLTVEIDLHSPHLHRLESVQQREKMDAKKVVEYRDLYREGHDLGTVTVFQDGEEQYVSDGFHRIEAALTAGLATLPALIKPGGIRDARLHACQSNRHGLSRTNADKRKAVTTMLTDIEGRTWSNNSIAHWCGVSLDLVNRTRQSLNESLSEIVPQPTTRVYRNRYGQMVTMDTAAIGQRVEPEPPLFPANGQGPDGDADSLMPDRSHPPQAQASGATLVSDIAPALPPSNPGANGEASDANGDRRTTPATLSAHEGPPHEALAELEKRLIEEVVGRLLPLTSDVGLEPVVPWCLNHDTFLEYLGVYVTAVGERFSSQAREIETLKEELA